MAETVKPSVSNGVRDNYGHEWASLRALAKDLRVSRNRIREVLNHEGAFKHNGRVYTLKSTPVVQINNALSNEEKACNELNITKEEYENFKALKNATELPFEKFDIKFNVHKKGVRYAIALFSDAHIEETVDPASVLGKNEYNVAIAEKRVKNYFTNLATCINKDHVEELIFASLGDTISAYIHSPT